jgi:hypothetical protein
MRPTRLIRLLRPTRPLRPTRQTSSPAHAKTPKRMNIKNKHHTSVSNEAARYEPRKMCRISCSKECQFAPNSQPHSAGPSACPALIFWPAHDIPAQTDTCSQRKLTLNFRLRRKAHFKPMLPFLSLPLRPHVKKFGSRNFLVSNFQSCEKTEPKNN